MLSQVKLNNGAGKLVSIRHALTYNLRNILDFTIYLSIWLSKKLTLPQQYHDYLKLKTKVILIRRAVGI